MSAELGELLHVSAEGRARPLDVARLVRTARRRRLARRTASTLGAVALIAAIPLVAAQIGSSRPTDLAITSTPDQDGGPPPVPAGWQTLTAGSLAVSVPPDWQIEVHDTPATPAPGRPVSETLGGPCANTQLGRALDDGPTAVVYELPGNGACNAAGWTTPLPPSPGLILYPAVHHDHDDAYPGQIWLQIAEENGERITIGDGVEVWRTGGPEIVGYVTIDGVGGLEIANPDHPTAREVLATVRRID